MWGALFDERTDLLQLLLALPSAVVLGSDSCGTHGHILLSQTVDSSNLKGQVSVFISCRNKVAMHPLFFASCESHGNNGNI
jgi:hypothetical protein